MSREQLANLWVLCRHDRSTVRRQLNLSTPLDSAIDRAADEMGRLYDAWQAAYSAFVRGHASDHDEACRLLDSLCDAFDLAKARHDQLVSAAGGNQ